MRNIMETILQAKDISKTYHTGSVDVYALKKCSLEFGKGEFTAIIERVVLESQHC